MNLLSRSTALKIAAVLSFLMGGFGVVVTLPMIAQGQAAIDSTPDQIPYVVLMIALLTAVMSMIAAYGTWKQQLWGIVLTILANGVNGLSALPGIGAPVPMFFVVAVATVIISVVIVVLCLWRDAKPALA